MHPFPPDDLDPATPPTGADCGPRSRYELVPQDPARGYAGGTSPYRVLVSATDAFCGRGVASHSLGLVGKLARELAALTGHGVGVEVARPSVVSAVDALADVRAAVRPSTDVVVVELEPTLVTGRELVEIGVELRALQACLAPQAHLVLLVQSPVPAEAAARLDRLLARFSGPVHLHLLSPRTADVRTDYARWARTLAVDLARRLRFPLHWVAEPDPVDDDARIRAVERLSILKEGWTERLQAVVGRTRAAYGSSCAAVTIIDQATVRFSPRIGPVTKEVERQHTLCDVTLSAYGGLIIGDARLDTRFDRLPGVVSGDVRYYVGQRIRDPYGTVIGTLCAYDRSPRTVSWEDLGSLRDLADEAERVIAAAL